MALLPEESSFTCVDPLRPNDPIETESAGTIVGASDNGYFSTKRKEVAQELKQRRPWMRVTEHEPLTGGRATRQVWQIPEMPWKEHRDERPTDNT
jgi:hypothetical protein